MAGNARCGSIKPLCPGYLLPRRCRTFPRRHSIQVCVCSKVRTFRLDGAQRCPLKCVVRPGSTVSPWQKSLNRLQLPGVRFRATLFTPSASNHAGSECHGVQVHVTNRDSFRPVEMALHLLRAARCLSGDAWKWNPHFERLAGSSAIRVGPENRRPA